MRFPTPFAPLAALVLSATAPAEALQFQTDNWTTECDFSGTGCSIIGTFSGLDRNGAKGSFALAVELQETVVAVVGQPQPVKGIIKVDKYPPIECRGLRYCLVSNKDSKRLIDQFNLGALILVDVFTTKSAFHSSMSTIGYRASVSKIIAQNH